MRLGVNIDHIATLRQQRTEGYPNLIEAAQIALKAGADLITIHLREDRRHIQLEDLAPIRKTAPVLNLEMASSSEMLEIATQIKPDWLCLVPEKRSELTTEGGLDIKKFQSTISKVIQKLQDQGIKVSLFIEPDLESVEVAKKLNADAIELHTGAYANAKNPQVELEKIKLAVQKALSLDLAAHAGHGLNLDNIIPIASVPGIQELNIGHSIIARAVFVGLAEAIREIKELI